MANVTTSAAALKHIGWEINEQDQDKEFVIDWSYDGKMKVFIKRDNELDNVTADYDVDFDQWQTDLEELKELNELEDENYTV